MDAFFGLAFFTILTGLFAATFFGLATPRLAEAGLAAAAAGFGAAAAAGFSAVTAGLAGAGAAFFGVGVWPFTSNAEKSAAVLSPTN